MAGIAHIRGLDEVHLSVKNLDGMKRFYTEILPFKEAFYHEDRMLGLDTGGAMLVLTASDEGSAGVKLGFECTGIAKLVEDLESKGVKVVHPIEKGHWGALLAGFEDPEGNAIYFEEPVQGTDSHQH